MSNSTQNCTCIESGYAQTTNHCPVHKNSTQNDWENSHDFKQAVYAADILLDTPYADPDDDIRTVARQFNRMVERYNTLAKELADARREVVRRIEAMPNKDVRPEITVWLEPKEYCLGYNKALNDVLATFRKEEV